MALAVNHYRLEVRQGKYFREVVVEAPSSVAAALWAQSFYNSNNVALVTGKNQKDYDVSRKHPLANSVILGKGGGDKYSALESKALLEAEYCSLISESKIQKVAPVKYARLKKNNKFPSRDRIKIRKRPK